jgi:hypothetical protein
MIFHPRIGQEVIINYRDKEMRLQGIDCEVLVVGKGPGPRNVLLIVPKISPNRIGFFYAVVPIGNLILDPLPI